CRTSEGRSSAGNVSQNPSDNNWSRPDSKRNKRNGNWNGVKVKSKLHGNKWKKAARNWRHRRNRRKPHRMTLRSKGWKSSKSNARPIWHTNSKKLPSCAKKEANWRAKPQVIAVA